MRKWLPLVTVCLGTLMLLIDVTIVNVALPDMAKDLKTSFGSLQWVIDAYALVLAALVLGTGSIADLVGHRRAYIFGLALFAIASLVCGLAPNSGALVAARAVQGVGAAAMFATTFALLNSNYTGRDRGVAYGMWGAVAGASAAIGPIAGGVLTEGISWRWIFFVNLPVSVLAIVMCMRVLEDVNAPARGRVDVFGIVAFSAAAGTLTYGLIHANEHGWSAPSTWLWLVASPVLLALFVLVEVRTEHPMLDLSLMRNRSFVGVVLASGCLVISAFAYLTYTSIWLQSVLGYSPIEAGLTTLPMSFSAFLVSAAIGRFLNAARPGPVIGGGVAIIGLGGLIGAALVHGSASWAELVPGFVLVGIGVGLATPTLNSAAMAAVPVQRGGMAGGTVNTSRQLGFALGIAVLGSVFSARAQHVLAAHHVPNSTGVSRGLAGGQAPLILHKAPPSVRGALDSALHSAAISGVQWAFLVGGVVGVLAGLAVFALVRQPAGTGDDAQSSAQAEPAGVQ